MLKRISLPSVTLICVTGVEYEKAKFALWRSQLGIKFHSVKLVTGSEVKSDRFLVVEKALDTQLDSIDAYNHYLIYDLWRHVETPYALVVQADGYVINAKLWDPNFLRFDYIGAPWALSESAYIDPFGQHIRVGNGGFSLRSRKLLTMAQMVDIPFDVNASDFYQHMDVGLLSEDGNICVHNRHLYERGGCVFAPLEVALNFSKETRLKENRGLATFGFHKRIPLRSLLPDLLLRAWFFGSRAIAKRLGRLASSA